MRETLAWAWQNKWVRLLVYLALAGLFLWFLAWLLSGARAALGIVAAAFVFSYMVSPVVRFFEARRLTRALGVVAVFVGMLFLLGLSTVLLASMVGQLARFAARLPGLFQPLLNWAQSLPEALGRVELPPLLREALAQATINLQDLLQSFTQVLLQALQGVFAQGGNLLGFLSGLLGGAFQLLTVITLSIYLLYDLPRIGATLFRAIPEPYQPLAQELAHKADLAFGGYVRGTILGALANGAVVGLAMYLSFGIFQGFGPPVFTQAISLGFLAFIFSFVPVLGVIISAIPALVLALPLGWGALLVVTLALWLCNQVAGVIWPIIMGRTTSLHPVTGIAAVLVGASLFGVVGALLAVPLVAFLKILYTDYYLKSRFYRMG
ncbi:MAG: AI-2E family transporter [Meiothermus sp.]|uniref:AI-2E family transporter n=1 Tax=Meiothermus sp. TaxID=1955249 RepID=UPI0025DC6D60|nr:AI-2E family transporter [Meiothermus sp.]MCS7069677.1 AI-2E family transporter [Meiothermus sp.]MCX7601411.1 AI-2E family transporter [Meiothermus sp.]MDW8426260.1 AI-2E family transporter [Meiothermus sp.]